MVQLWLRSSGRVEVSRGHSRGEEREREAWVATAATWYTRLRAVGREERAATTTTYDGGALGSNKAALWRQSGVEVSR